MGAFTVFTPGNTHVHTVLAFLFSFSVLTACETRTEMAMNVVEEMEPFFDHQELDPQPITGLVISEDHLLGRPRDVEIVGEYIVVADMASEHRLHVLHRRSHEHVGSFGRSGEGPGEFASSPVLSTIDGVDDRFAALNPTYRRVTFFGLPEGAIVPFGATDAVDLPTQHFVNDLKMIDGKRAAGVGFFQDGRLALFDLVTKQAEFTGTVPGASDEPFLIRQQAHHAFLALSADQRRIAVVTRLTTDVDIYGTSGEHLARAETPYDFAVDYMLDEGGNFMPGPRNRHGYQGVTASDSAIFALFSGRAEAHFRGMSGIHSEFIHVFDWEGNLTRVLQLDREVLEIAIDPTGSRLYAITERPQPAVLVYSVSSLI